MRYKPTGIRSSDQIHRINTQARRYRGGGGGCDNHHKNSIQSFTRGTTAILVSIQKYF